MTTPWRIAFVCLAVLVLTLTVIVLGMLRRFSVAVEGLANAADAETGPLLGLRPGARVRSFTVDSIERGALLLPQGAPAEVSVLLLVDSDCAPCATLLDTLRADGWGVDIPLLVVLPDDPDARRAAPVPGAHMFYQRDRVAFDAFGANATPLAFAVDRRGIIHGRAVPEGMASLRELAETAVPNGDISPTDVHYHDGRRNT